MLRHARPAPERFIELAGDLGLLRERAKSYVQDAETVGFSDDLQRSNARCSMIDWTTGHGPHRDHCLGSVERRVESDLAGVDLVEQPDGTLGAYKKARRVLQRAADALANQTPDTPPAAGVADDSPTSEVTFVP